MGKPREPDPSHDRTDALVIVTQLNRLYPAQSFRVVPHYPWATPYVGRYGEARTHLDVWTNGGGGWSMQKPIVPSGHHCSALMFPLHCNVRRVKFGYLSRTMWLNPCRPHLFPLASADPAFLSLSASTMQFTTMSNMEDRGILDWAKQITRASIGACRRCYVFEAPRGPGHQCLRVPQSALTPSLRTGGPPEVVGLFYWPAYVAIGLILRRTMTIMMRPFTLLCAVKTATRQMGHVSAGSL